MKNHDKAALPKIQIKQVQVLNRAFTGNATKYGNQAGFIMTQTTTDTIPTNTVTGII
ncbi:hypothetical protein [Mucilaginibacter endophyticus]|jgi:hypothetical protein|uniref:hypothetical protein n=1 Tax=Mucilaginibacter endophyticus TaxID=2675003 RepID=UPI0012B17636|nr:hypothetical protein [Mucilaginibacter endophyticus]